MFLLVDFSSRHVFPTANWVGESCERRFPWQISGTVPAVSPKGTSAHPFSILQRRHYTFLTHFTVHDEAYFIYRVHTFICGIGFVEHAENTEILHVAYVSNTILIFLPWLHFVFDKILIQDSAYFIESMR